MLIVLNEFISRISPVLIIIAGGTVLEFLSEYEVHNFISRIRGLMFWMFYLAGTAVAVSLFSDLAAILGIKPLLVFDFRSLASTGNLGLTLFCTMLFALIPTLLGDFLYYWFHRLQHAVPLLWRFHSVHHAIQELSIANCAHHVTEDIFKNSFMFLPLTLLVQFQVTQVLFLSIFLGSWSFLVHSNSWLSLGPLDYVITRPLYHRIHHSMDPLHHDCNFCGLFPIWDMLFRTAYFPTRGERIKTGLSDKCEAKTVGQYLFALRSPKDTTVASEQMDVKLHMSG